jgi:2-oxo-4-hydroxy-4-carboxy-5-ureidoimidazoline decarboxylase
VTGATGTTDAQRCGAVRGRGGTLARRPLTRQSVGMGTERLTWFNELPAATAQQALLDCCSAPGWAEQMAAARPYASADDAVRQSGAIVAALTVTDLTAALAGHPRIGEQPAGGGDRPRAADWSRQEQSGVDAEDTATSRALAEANREYERRFGHIYLVCAAGRTGTELLGVLRGRLQNEPEDEWQVVRSELQKINALRLQRLVAGLP